jgi:hypothetical protein
LLSDNVVVLALEFKEYRRVCVVIVIARTKFVTIAVPVEGGVIGIEGRGIQIDAVNGIGAVFLGVGVEYQIGRDEVPNGLAE